MKVKGKVTITEEYYGEDYGDGSCLSGETIVLEHGEEKHSYKVVEGEPEDMSFGRDLEDTYSIKEMIILAHKLGKQGVDLEFVNIEERD
tara:strand:- start:275 stop:541 length:267 start_codon:yes stop_codon:yes gene_type:complete